MRPFIFTATVVDEVTKEIFTIEVSNRRIVIAPRSHCGFDTFMRFLRVIQERFDPEATVQAVE